MVFLFFFLIAIILFEVVACYQLILFIKLSSAHLISPQLWKQLDAKCAKNHQLPCKQESVSTAAKIIALSRTTLNFQQITPSNPPLYSSPANPQRHPTAMLTPTPSAGTSWKEIVNLATTASTPMLSSSINPIKVKSPTQKVPRACYQQTISRVLVQPSKQPISTPSPVAFSLRRGTAKTDQTATLSMADRSSFYFKHS